MDVRRAEVVTPFRDAMGFVDCDTRELALSVDRVEVLTEGLGKCILWGDIQETGARMA